MFRTRPVITSSPAAVAHGGSFAVNTPSATSIVEVILIRPAATTHGFNMSQRIVNTFSRLVCLFQPGESLVLVFQSGVNRRDFNPPEPVLVGFVDGPQSLATLGPMKPFPFLLGRIEQKLGVRRVGR